MEVNINNPCKHYERGCLIQAPCCKIWYPCRLCHNNEYRGPKGPGCTVETLDRYQISRVRCLKCQKEQEPSSVCENEECKHVLGKYFCKVCKLFNNNEKKDMFHCNKCNMCRMGKEEDNFHCNICDICMSNSLKNNHVCLENKTESNCPICLENLKISTDPWQQLERCGHCIHLKCYNKYIRKMQNPNCPSCGVSQYKQSQEEKKHIEDYIKTTNEMMDDSLKKIIKGKKTKILCNECGQKSFDIDFNIVAHKCSHCGCYNTKEIV